jgi:ketol-acid reductoisomerase
MKIAFITRCATIFELLLYGCLSYRKFKILISAVREIRSFRLLVAHRVFIGTGNVGAPLADRLQKLGHQVFIAARDPQSKSVQEATNRNAELIVKSAMEAVQESEVIFLATPFGAIQ